MIIEQTVSPPSFRLGKAYAIDFSSDGSLLASLADNVELWGIKERNRLNTFDVPSNPSSLMFSPDGSQLVVVNTAGTVVVLDIRSGKSVCEFNTSKKGKQGSNIVFSDDGSEIIYGSWDGDLFVYNRATCACIYKTNFDNAMITCITYSSVTKTFFFAIQNKWSKDNPKLSHSIVYNRLPFSDAGFQKIDEHKGTIKELRISNDGKKLAILGNRKKNDQLIVQDITTNKAIASRDIKPSGTPNKFCWSPDDSVIAFTGDHQVTVFDSLKLKPIGFIPLQYACDVLFSPDGSFLAIGSWEKGLVLNTDQIDFL
ncbi:MAG: hypothetical protein AB1724_07235 [Thermodesulfobacteriota bacterium]